MAIDITSIIKDLTAKITADKDLLSSFKTNPIKVVEKLLGIDLPDEQIKLVVEGIKAKISGKDSDIASNVVNTITNLFGNKK